MHPQELHVWHANRGNMGSAAPPRSSVSLAPLAPPPIFPRPQCATNVSKENMLLCLVAPHVPAAVLAHTPQPWALYLVSRASNALLALSPVPLRPQRATNVSEADMLLRLAAPPVPPAVLVPIPQPWALYLVSRASNAPLGSIRRPEAPAAPAAALAHTRQR